MSFSLITLIECCFYFVHVECKGTLALSAWICPGDLGGMALVVQLILGKVMSGRPMSAHQLGNPCNQSQTGEFTQCWTIKLWDSHTITTTILEKTSSSKWTATLNQDLHVINYLTQSNKRFNFAEILAGGIEIADKDVHA